jgi:hypothetical protein
MLQIDNIEVMWLDDSEEPTASEKLGYYSVKPSLGAIDRSRDNGYQPTEFRYWNPMHYNPDHPENARQDYLRHEALCRGEWCYQFCVARATVSYEIGEDRRIEVLSSGGVGGIESDCSLLFLTQNEIEQLENLKAHVQVFGVPWTEPWEKMLIESRNRLVVLRSQVEQTHPE